MPFSPIQTSEYLESSFDMESAVVVLCHKEVLMEGDRIGNSGC